MNKADISSSVPQRSRKHTIFFQILKSARFTTPTDSTSYYAEALLLLQTLVAAVSQAASLGLAVDSVAAALSQAADLVALEVLTSPLPAVLPEMAAMGLA